MMRHRFVLPAIVGGVVTGVLSALPFISAGNICCCLWVVAGGAAAAYLLQQNQPAPIPAGDGALVGLLAGLLGAAVYLVLSIPITIVVAPMERAILERLLRSSEGMPPELREYLDAQAGVGVRIVIGFLTMLFVGPLFSTLGGVLGSAIFRTPAPGALPAAPPGSLPPVPQAPSPAPAHGATSGPGADTADPAPRGEGTSNSDRAAGGNDGDVRYPSSHDE
jgi:hypothetical protein